MHTKPDRVRALAELLVMVLAGLACALPVSGPAATQTPVDTPAPTATLTALPSATAVPSVTATLPLPPAATITNAPVITPATVDTRIYLVAIGDNGANGPSIGCGDSLVAVRRAVVPSGNPVADTLSELLAQRSQFYGESGLFNALWQSNLAVQSAEVDASGAATVAIAGQVQLGGVCDIPRFKGQIEQTILAVEGVKSASIFLNGRPIDDALSQR